MQNELEFLGYRFTQQGVSVRDASYNKFIHSVLGIITRYKHGRSEKNIENPAGKKTAFLHELNEKITGAIDGRRRYGWVFFFSEIDDVSLLHQIDRVIISALTRANNLSKEDIKQVKSVTRAYFEAKHSPERGYVHNYNVYQTHEDKIRYLSLIGWIKHDPNATYSDKQINQMFEQAKTVNLLKLQRDVSILS